MIGPEDVSVGETVRVSYGSTRWDGIKEIEQITNLGVHIQANGCG